MNPLQQLRNTIGSQYTDEEFNKTMELNRNIAGKVVCGYLACLLEEVDKEGTVALRQEVVNASGCEFSGSIALELKELEGYTLNVCLAIVAKGYKTEISVPSEDYTKDLYTFYDNVKKCAQAYWMVLQSEHPDLMEKIFCVIPEMRNNFLVIDPENNTSLFAVEKSNIRISVFCYYRDPQGNALVKKAKE